MQAVRVAARGVEIDGDLAIPAEPKGVILFAHGSGSSRHSPRNRFVARELNLRGFGTLMLDLLTRAEEAVDDRTARIRFDILLLADRLGCALSWLSEAPPTTDLPIGCFGASTGAAAALVCAARFPEIVGAVVSRGGRPDLAEADLGEVRAPTLLIVGAADPEVIDLNEAALRQMRCVRQLEIVPHATHLFPEPGALEAVARLACEWFETYLFPLRRGPREASGSTASGDEGPRPRPPRG